MHRSTVAAGIALVLTSSFAFAQQGRDETTFTWAKELAAGSHVTILNANGPIMVRESSGGRVEVRATKVIRGRGSVRDIAFDVRESGGDVEICTLYNDQASCRDRNRGSNRGTNIRVEYSVLVPRSMRVDFATGNGDVHIDRAGAEVVATTGNGRIEIGETTGRVDATTGNGDVTVESANGPVKVRTGNGRISVTTAQGAVNASSGNGDIDVRMKSSTDSDMSFTTGSGALRIRLPADFNGRVDATSGSGSLQSDFEISVLGRLDARHVRGTIGKGGPLLRLITGSGQIELRKN